MSEHQIHKVAGILLKDNKILVIKLENFPSFMAPGGRIDEGESVKGALIRELLEELKINVSENDLVEFGTYTARAVGQEHKIVKIEVYVVNKWAGEPEADNEIEEILWIDSTIPKHLKGNSIFEHEVIPRLKKQGLID